MSDGGSSFAGVKVWGKSESASADDAGTTLRESFEQRGYAAPLRAIETSEAAEICARLDEHIEQHGPLTKAQHNNPHLLFAWADALIRDERITDRIAEIYGEDLLVWGSTFFIKPAERPGFVSWHQDSTYWGLDPANVVTAWIALSDSSEDNGALCLVPGSHAADQMPHRDTFSDNNMLSRGQEIAVDIDPGDAVCLQLAPGEMSLHHVRMIHGSGPNRSTRPRIGLAIRYLSTGVRQIGSTRDSATLVRGEDRYGNFDPEQAPKVDFAPDAVAFHQHIEDRLKQIIMN